MPSGDFGADATLPVDPWVLGRITRRRQPHRGHDQIVDTSDAMLRALAQRVARRARAGCTRAASTGEIVRGAVRPCRVKGPVPESVDGRLEGDGALGLAVTRSSFRAPIWTRSRAASARFTVRAARYRWLGRALGLAALLRRRALRLRNGVVELVRSLGGWCTRSSKRAFFEHRGERREGRVSFVCNIVIPDPRSLLLISDKQARLEACRRGGVSDVRVDRAHASRAYPVHRRTHPSSLYLPTITSSRTTRRLRSTSASTSRCITRSRSRCSRWKWARRSSRCG